MKRYALLLCTWYCIISMHLINAENIQHPLDAHDVTIEFDDLEDVNENQVLRKPKKLCRLCVACLNVTKKLFVNGQEVTGGPGTFTASYGQLSLTSQTINLDPPNTWVPVPFNIAGPTSNMSVSTTSPATITVQKNGVYQINASLYFLAEDSDEGSFTPTTYILGLSVNGVTTPTIQLSLTQSGHYLLPYNSFMALSANDQVQFYMQSSNGEDIMANHITLETGNAYLVQISN